MIRLGMIEKPNANEEEVDLRDEIKIFYCSRTHSQLTQFANEVRRVKIPISVAQEQVLGTEGSLAEEVKHLTLGSRKNLCINSQVSRLGSTVAINERCLELQKPKISSDHKCAFLPNKENESLVNEFRDHALAKVRDIEDLGLLGTKLRICPYYASRAAIKPSEVSFINCRYKAILKRSKIITLPYPLLLQKSAREALDISLKDHIVIVDEAHNLMDAISSIYSTSVTLTQLQNCRGQIGVYLQKFRNKLKGKNRVYVTQTVRFVDSLIGYLDEKAKTNRQSDGAVSISDFMTGKGVDQINLYKLERYLQESKLARKVDGYISHKEKVGESQSQARISTTPVLTHIQNFLQSLVNPATEGRFFYSKTDSKDVCLKYMLLDPTHHFREIVDEARAVILAGGTMSPVCEH